MATLDDALALITDLGYVADPMLPAAVGLEQGVGRVVAALLNRGAESDVHALALARDAVESIGDRELVADHRTNDPRLSRRRRMWVASDAVHH